MPDFQDDAITSWASSAPEEVGRIPDPRTDLGVEWQGVLEVTARLGVVLDEGAAAEAESLVASLRNPDILNELRAVLGGCGARVTLRLIAWLTEELAGGIAVCTDLLDRRSDSTVSGQLAESERSALLVRVFAPDRLRDLEEACRAATIVQEAA